MKFDQSLTRRNALAVGAAAFGAAMTQSLTAADKDLPWIDAFAHLAGGSGQVPARRTDESRPQAAELYG